MSFLITLGFVEILFDLLVDKVKRELVGATTTKRERVDDGEFHVLNEDMVDAVVRVGVNIGVDAGVDVGGGIGVGVGVSFHQARGNRPYPGGMDWIGVKRVIAVTNVEKKYFVTLEIFLHEGHMNVYGCNMMVYEHNQFLTFILPVFELLPILLRQSEIMKHLLEKFINEPCEFKGRVEFMVKNEIGAARRSYSLAFIEHLITDTTMNLPTPSCVIIQFQGCNRFGQLG
ncbi:hypothetical protein H5410_056979 [Solanum commersonii]|uniref:Uncharacterized protein n=1 Tax=Solanum commersonii TaxID=4109 RepID=A0A9J5WNC1_SOLCO|nr:hypothetical protein H5410_056979 [Solanum commersonii]